MRNVSSMKRMINIVKGMFLNTKVHYVPGIQISLTDRELMTHLVEEASAKMMLNRKGCSVTNYPMKDSKGNIYGDFVILQDAHMIAVDEIFVSNDISIVELIQMMDEMEDYVVKIQKRQEFYNNTGYFDDDEDYEEDEPDVDTLSYDDDEEEENKGADVMSELDMEDLIRGVAACKDDNLYEEEDFEDYQNGAWDDYAR